VIGQVGKQYARAGRQRHWRVMGLGRQVTYGAPAIATALVDATKGARVLNTACIERLNATFRQHLVGLGVPPAPWPGGTRR
jgi:hypothetical protein